MQQKPGYRPTSTELYETFRTHYAARKNAQRLGVSMKALKEIARQEDNAWIEYVAELRRAHQKRRDAGKFIAPSRPV